jgi:hypothetical protein
MVGTILEMLGHRLDDDMLAEIIAEVDADGAYVRRQNTYYRILLAKESWQQRDFS